MTWRTRSFAAARIGKVLGAKGLRGTHVLAAVCAVAAAVSVAPAAQAEDLLPPSSDSFFGYDASLVDLEPGAVLKERAVQVPIGAGVVGATQLLFRTTGQTGAPLLGVTTVMRPANAGELTKIVAFQNFYDALGAQCNPSYTLRGGGNPGDYGRYVDQAVIGRYLDAGYTVVATDYEGIDLAFGAGRQSGQVTLDGIRAAQRRFGADPGRSPVVMVGYSGGSIATEFATEAAANGYAPELNIVGVAEGGFPVDYRHSIEYVNGTQIWSRVIPLILGGLARGYGIDLDPYLSERGKQVMADVQGRCLTDEQFTGTIEELLRPEYQAYTEVPELARMLTDTRMRVVGNPTAPMYAMIGNSDGRGDGVMVAADERALLRDYCAEGVPVQFREVASDHVTTGLAFMAAVAPFVDERFNGAPAVNDCAAI